VLVHAGFSFIVNPKVCALLLQVKEMILSAGLCMSRLDSLQNDGSEHGIGPKHYHWLFHLAPQILVGEKPDITLNDKTQIPSLKFAFPHPNALRRPIEPFNFP
jgi:hypothetical protein